MNEQQLRKIIAQGENESVDFKRELHLENPSQKSEFIKDLISLANSATDIGYLIIGVDNNGDLYGTEALTEERLQQIAHTYIYPNIVLGYSNLMLDSKLIGIIEIQGTEKPHRVIKSIDRLLMNDVFVRHGSTTAKASPDEMFRMRENDTDFQREIKSFTQGAEKHLKLGNIDQAITAYSKAIDLMPTSELMFARGKARMEKFEVDPDSFFTSYLPVEIGELSLKDFEDALELQETPILEKEIRLARLELFSMCPLKDKIWESDFVWAEDNISDEEYGKVLFHAALKMNVFSFYAGEGWDSDVIIKYIDLASKLGFEDPKAYYLRASAHFYDYNLGFALNDINYAINLVRNDNQILLDCLNLRVGILKSMGKFDLAYDDLGNASKIRKDNKNHSFRADWHRLTDEIYQCIAIQWKFEFSERKWFEHFRPILQILLLNQGLPTYLGFSDTDKVLKIPSGLFIEEEFPYIAPILNEIVGKEVWQAAKQGLGYDVELRLKKGNE